MPSSPFVRRVRRFARKRGLIATPATKAAPAKAAPAKAAPAKAAAPGVPLAVKRSRSAPGSRVVEHMYFDDYPRFYETSETTPFRGRLNLRHEAIFSENADVFEGKTVLDISSHDGRWTMAALSAGASHVIGIEARPELVEYAKENLDLYGVDPSRYTFVAGDVFDVMAKEKIDVDVVICLGFMYHTLRYNELMTRIRQCNPDYVIIDTAVQAGFGGRAMMQLKLEDISEQRNAVADEFSTGNYVLSGKPTVKGLRMIAEAYDYELERFSDWGGLVRDNPEQTKVDDYAKVARLTARLRARGKDDGSAFTPAANPGA